MTDPAPTDEVTRCEIPAPAVDWSADYGDPVMPLRFWLRVYPEPNTGCWLWGGRTNSEGYGMFSTDRQRNRRSHRVAFEGLIRPLRAEEELDHLCRVRWCVNPAHLEPVSRRTNLLRGQSPVGINYAKTHCPKGHPYDFTYRLPTGSVGRGCRRCRVELERRHELRRGPRDRSERYR